MDKNIILSVDGLTKHYKNFSLKDVTIHIEKGKITGFIGNNGAGKTTTLRCILGLSPFQKGEIKVNGFTMKENEEKFKSLVGVVFDAGYFYEFLTLNQMKGIVKKSYSNWNDSVYQEYLQKFSLRGDSKISELSKGMKMKYSLAIALSHDAQILILDEPASGLDPKSRNWLCEELLAQKEQGKTIFFSTHITSDLDKIGDNIVLLDQGEILYSGSKAEFVSLGKTPADDIEAIMLAIINDRSKQ